MLGCISLLSILIIIGVCSVETVYCLCLDEMYITLVFGNIKCHAITLHQERTFWRSVVRDWTTFSTDLCDVLRVVTSANISPYVLVSDKGSSFIYIYIYIKKSMGPSTEPCGIPEITGFLSDSRKIRFAGNDSARMKKTKM